MKKGKVFGVFVLVFFAIFFLTSILVGSILICINNFTDLSGMMWFWHGLKISCIISVIGAVLIIHGTKRIRETKLSFWFEKNYPKLLLVYIIAILALASMKSEPTWTADMVYDVLSLQWTIFGLSLTIFLVWPNSHRSHPADRVAESSSAVRARENPKRMCSWVICRV